MPSFERRHIVGAAVVVVIVGLAVAVTAVIINRRDGAPAGSPWPRSIVFYGDSLTRGAFTTAPGRAFPALVDTSLADNGNPPRSTVIADYGIGVGAFLRRTPAPPVTADLYVVELGTNDLGKQDVPAFSATYGRLLDSLGAASSHALVCLGPWGPPEISTALEAAISAACVQHGGAFTSISDLYANASNRGPSGRVLQGLTTDSVHPNDAGHAAIARVVTDAAEPLRKSLG